MWGDGLSHNPKPFGENTVCPICGSGIPTDENVGKYAGALSRFDNDTEICSQCGQYEALGPYFDENIRAMCYEAQSIGGEAGWEMWKIAIQSCYIPGSED